MLEVTTRLRLTGLRRFKTQIQTGGPPIATILTKWTARYRGFVWDRYDRFSKGGGTWRPLSPATVARRRKGKGTGPVATILRDTNTLMSALHPIIKGPGGYEEQRPHTFVVIVGYGGPARHKRSKKATISEVASYHNDGGGRLPKRLIIVPPDNRVVERMIADAQTELVRAAQREIQS